MAEFNPFFDKDASTVCVCCYMDLSQAHGDSKSVFDTLPMTAEAPITMLNAMKRLTHVSIFNFHFDFNLYINSFFVCS